MEVKREYPPNYDKIIERFPAVKDKNNVVFTYGDTLFAPYFKEDERTPLDLEIHELTHKDQQGDDPDGWWEKYFEDAEFRKKQEVEAYHEQFRFIKHRFGQNKAQNYIVHLASELASPIYDLDLTYNQAEKLIKKGYESI